MGGVIDPKFCVPGSGPVNQEIFKTTDGDYIVQDVHSGIIIFKAEGKLFKFHDGFRLNDANGHPVVTLRKKIATAHARWQVFKGHSIDPKDLLFTAVKTSMVQLKTKLHVFLANNTAEESFDYKVEESWSHDRCNIYARNPSIIVAEMHKRTGKSGNFVVKVNPEMDYAFVTAIILILDAMNKSLNLPVGTISAVGTAVSLALEA
ncbi:Protein LURP-one-related 15 [Morella rubra]|uniref:Protein LURP-one-related 15 n=1 Tax=Morella rubra TaxID=262757 RepID=A0A6A1WGZ9_9ROSI|nr:Protein LURP-one-related 15 [Morella rubra]